MTFWQENYPFIKDVYIMRQTKMIEWMENVEKAISRIMADKVYTSAEFKRERDNFHVSRFVLWQKTTFLTLCERTSLLLTHLGNQAALYWRWYRQDIELINRIIFADKNNELAKQQITTKRTKSHSISLKTWVQNATAIWQKQVSRKCSISELTCHILFFNFAPTPSNPLRQNATCPQKKVDDVK